MRPVGEGEARREAILVEHTGFVRHSLKLESVSIKQCVVSFLPERVFLELFNQT